MNIAQALQIAQEHLLGRRPAQAAEIARQILAIDSKNIFALQTMGLAASVQANHELALEMFQKSIELTLVPTGDQLFFAGETYRQLMRFDESIATLERAISVLPSHADAHLSLALSLLILGRYERGLDEFEWRWKSTRLNTQRINFAQPTWDGSDPAGKTILLWAEQGLGDVMQCMRYAPLLAKRGAKVAIGCQVSLERLLKTLPDISVVTSRMDGTPPFQLQMSSFGLMKAFNTTVQTIPQNVPYLFADPVLSVKWKEKLAGDRARLKVGLVWAGRADNPTDADRSIPLAALTPLLALKDVCFYGLQIDDRNPQATVAIGIKPLGDQLTDLAETAAVLDNLDLLISVDTAPVHLAGAMGKPVWNLIAWFNDWRWMLNRGDSPWYPSMRIFRQKTRGDWKSVIAEVIEALSVLMLNPSGLSGPPRP
ncbi:MAG TPA: tetratricopeptide repeat-containing glycosyltransferase family protein [Tepidisphaeraceae bacterium]|nr:tetratricopeptide repeat-containing glycosyltransferase family protein [Tepidisphaeraceae bacterium]